MKKLKIRIANETALIILTLLILAGLVVSIVLPSFYFSEGEASKIFLIVFTGFMSFGCLLVTIIFTAREVKLVKRLNKLRETLGDDALFFRGKLVVEGLKQSALSVGDIILIVLFSAVGLFIVAVKNAIKGAPSTSRIFLLYNDGLYAFELTNKKNILCKRGSLKPINVYVSKEIDVNLTLRGQDVSAAYNGKRVTITFNTNGSSAVIDDLKQRLKALFPYGQEQFVEGV